MDGRSSRDSRRACRSSGKGPAPPRASQGSHRTRRWREMDSNHRVPREGPTRRDGFIRPSSGGSEAHHRRSAIFAGTITAATTTTASAGDGGRLKTAALPDGGPMVRILLPPAVSPPEVGSVVVGRGSGRARAHAPLWVVSIIVLAIGRTTRPRRAESPRRLTPREREPGPRDGAAHRASDEAAEPLSPTLPSSSRRERQARAPRRPPT